MAALESMLTALSREDLSAIALRLYDDHDGAHVFLHEWAVAPLTPVELRVIREHAKDLQRIFRVAVRNCLDDDWNVHPLGLSRVHTCLGHGRPSRQIRQPLDLSPRGDPVEDAELADQQMNVRRLAIAHRVGLQHVPVAKLLELKLGASTREQLGRVITDLYSSSTEVANYLNKWADGGPTQEQFRRICDELFSMREVYVMVYESTQYGDSSVFLERLEFAHAQLRRGGIHRSVLMSCSCRSNPGVPTIRGVADPILLLRAEHAVILRQKVQFDNKSWCDWWLSDYIQAFGGGMEHPLIEDQFYSRYLPDCQKHEDNILLNPGQKGCSFCGRCIGSFQLCAGCKAVGKLVRYCSRDCQKSAWRNGHKARCGLQVASSMAALLECGVGKTVDH